MVAGLTLAFPVFQVPAHATFTPFQHRFSGGVWNCLRCSSRM